MKTALHTFLSLGLCLGSASLFAQSAETPPVGFVSKTIPAGADATYAPAFHRAPVFVGIIEAIPDSTTLQVKGSPEWDLNEFSNSHYVLISSGPKNGLFAEISGNSASSVSLNFLIGNLGTTPGDSVEVGDQVKVIPYWTLGTLMPQDSVPNNTDVFLFNRSQVGVNKSASSIYRHYTGFGWYSGSNPGADQIIYPDESIIIRAPSGVEVQLTQVGTVPLSNVRTILSNLAPGQDQDIRVTSTLPVSVPVGNLFAPGSIGNLDKLLIFNDSAGGRNKAASVILTYYTGFGWYNGSNDMNQMMIEPGQGLLYRKIGANSSHEIMVNYVPPYSN